MSGLDFRFDPSFPMQLSVIIVNYNVKHFLEQCLYSVREAITGLTAEVIVIDNNSTDNSMEYLPPRFPTVRFVANKENTGFAKACNQGLSMASGKYILFLNPDTIVPEDCFTKCIAFMESRPEAGGLGIRMIDGSGKFLKESKRAFPSPLTSLYKLFGLAKLFPRSKVFSHYHLGHLDERQNNEVDVLAGAFMLIRKEVLDKIGSFDENFFMYGEDVDLSYRIQKAGYKNYYFADSSIIHFKGESTRKGSMNYVRMFYTAMSKFVRKHYGGSRAGVFNFLVHTGIWFRAALTATGNFIRSMGLPLIDAGLILLSFWLAKNFWNEYVKTDIHYENKLLWIAFPAFTVFYLVSAYYAGLYDRWYRRTELIRATLIATVLLLAAYSMLPEQYRFSRAILLFGAFLAFVFISILRWILIRSGVLNSSREKEQASDTVIVATEGEYESITTLLKKAGLRSKALGRVAVTNGDGQALGYWKELDKLPDMLPYREVIFCRGHLQYKDIVESIQRLPAGTETKIHAVGSSSLVGSQSKDVSGESVSVENGLQLSNPYNRRIKRLVDASLAFFGLISFPIQFLLVRKPISFLRNCFSVLFGNKTWVGYALRDKTLPRLRPAIIASNGIHLPLKQQLPEESLRMIDYWYARDYDPVNDIKLLWKVYRRLGG
jgi:GT2 family glycosyltransferase